MADVVGGWGLGRGLLGWYLDCRDGYSFDRDGEGERPDLDEVAVLEDAGAAQHLVVDDRPVPAPEVADGHLVPFDREFRVLATDLLAVRTQMAGIGAADLEDRPDQGDDLPLGFTLNDD